MLYTIAQHSLLSYLQDPPVCLNRDQLQSTRPERKIPVAPSALAPSAENTLWSEEKQDVLPFPVPRALETVEISAIGPAVCGRSKECNQSRQVQSVVHIVHIAFNPAFVPHPSLMRLIPWTEKLKDMHWWHLLNRTSILLCHWLCCCFCGRRSSSLLMDWYGTRDLFMDNLKYWGCTGSQCFE